LQKSKKKKKFNKLKKLKEYRQQRLKNLKFKPKKYKVKKPEINLKRSVRKSMYQSRKIEKKIYIK
jgi:hypothetical protein